MYSFVKVYHLKCNNVNYIIDLLGVYSVALYLRRLRDLREDHDCSQADVALLLGISQTVYSRYERGFQTIPLEHLLTLSEYYKVSLDYLTDGAIKNEHGRRH